VRYPTTDKICSCFRAGRIALSAKTIIKGLSTSLEIDRCEQSLSAPPSTVTERDRAQGGTGGGVSLTTVFQRKTKEKKGKRQLNNKYREKRMRKRAKNKLKRRK